MGPPLFRLAATFAGVEPLVSTRPSDPRKRGEGTCRDLSVPRLPLAAGIATVVRGYPPLPCR
ncbi:hypothetical protein ACCT09_44120, partial [Rhizobium ruizarguesonis]